MLKVKDNIKKISIVIPLFNEENNVIPLLKEIEQSLKSKCQFEVVAVNDGSKDKTLSNLVNFKSRYFKVNIINLKKNYGQSISLRAGIISAKYQTIVTLDGDGQNDPKDILKIIKSFNLEKNFFIVIGNRVNRIDNISRKIASKLALLIRSLIFRDTTPDTGCALKAFNKKDFLLLPFFNHIHRFLPIMFKLYGGQVLSIDVNHRERITGKSKYSNFQRMLVGIYDIIGVLWLKKRTIWPTDIKINKN